MGRKSTVNQRVRNYCSWHRTPMAVGSSCRSTTLNWATQERRRCQSCPRILIRPDFASRTVNGWQSSAILVLWRAWIAICASSGLRNSTKPLLIESPFRSSPNRKNSRKISQRINHEKWRRWVLVRERKEESGCVGINRGTDALIDKHTLLPNIFTLAHTNTLPSTLTDTGPYTLTCIHSYILTLRCPHSHSETLTHKHASDHWCSHTRTPLSHTVTHTGIPTPCHEHVRSCIPVILSFMTFTDMISPYGRKSKRRLSSVQLGANPLM